MTNIINNITIIWKNRYIIEWRLFTNLDWWDMTRIYDISDQQYLWYLGLSENDCLKTWQLYWKTDYESSDLGCPILRQTHLRACTSSPVGFQQTYKRWFQLHKNCDFTEYWSPAMGNSAATRVILPVTSRILVANMKFQHVSTQEHMGIQATMVRPTYQI
jgi:hypothetical protein